MNLRNALIIVVPENKNDAKYNLPVVRRDAEALEYSLRQSNYHVKTLGMGSASDVSKGSIRTAIRKACSEVPEGGTLLIFYSGHGLHFNGHDYLVPWDADLNDSDFDSFLVRIGDISPLVEESAARNVVLFIDACREGVQLREQKSLSLQSWTLEKRKHVTTRRYWTVFSCDAGEYSAYVSGDSGYSLFSRAIAQVLTPDNPARTLRQVLEGAQIALDELARANDRPRQTIKLQRESDVEGDIQNAVICDGNSAAVTVQRTATWEDVVRYSRLWDNVSADSEDSSALLSAFRTAAGQIVRRAEAYQQSVIASHGSDPWQDQNYPIRVLRRLEDLTNNAGSLALSASEVALLVVAPFVREHAYAAAIQFHLPVQPLVSDLNVIALPESVQEARQRLDATYKSYPQLIRRSQSLHKNAKGGRKGKSQRLDSRNLMLWTFHRHLARSAVQWEPSPYGSLPRDVGDLEFDDSASPSEQIITESLLSRRLLKLAKCVRCEPERLIRRDIPEPLENIIQVTIGDERIRERMLGALLCLAGWMAIDLRGLSDVVVDHVGIGDPVDPDSIKVTAACAVWTPLGRVLQLTATCPHPAVDFAFRELVGDANRILTAVLQISAQDPVLQKMAAELPAQLTADGLTAPTHGGRPAYSVPHQRFTLANDEIREILMGEELYGDPNLAIRELYQNALDACRYRKARTEYLARRGQRTQWQGRIIFTQGVIGGRPFIECEDNGIGMGMREIESCFAKAGRRFSDLPEFIEEQQLWLNAQPKIQMTPNSRFGIGVLSYFMIADEIEVSTCRLDREGMPSVKVMVTIPGSGSLFRVQNHGLGGEAGTRIRLYLRSDWDGSCLEVLKQFLYLAEFQTEVTGSGGDLKWKPFTPLDSTRYAATASPNLWWDGEFASGNVVADGIATSFHYNIDEKHTLFPSQRQPVGVLLNLSGVQRPRLTVDRKAILSYEWEWTRELIQGQLSHLSTASWLRLTWLWQLSDPVARLVERYLVAEDVYIPIGYPNEIGRAASSRKSDEATKQANQQSEFFRLSYPLRIVGIDKKDDTIITNLLNCHSATTSRDRLDLINLCVLPYVNVDRPRDPAIAEEWSQTKLDSIRNESWFHKEPQIRRMATYAKLGFPIPDWLRTLLPDIDLGEASAARRLEKPFASPSRNWRRFLPRGLWVFAFVMTVVIAIIFARL